MGSNLPFIDSSQHISRRIGDRGAADACASSSRSSRIPLERTESPSRSPRRRGTSHEIRPLCCARPVPRRATSGPRGDDEEELRHGARHASEASSLAAWHERPWLPDAADTEARRAWHISCFGSCFGACFGACCRASCSAYCGSCRGLSPDVVASGARAGGRRGSEETEPRATPARPLRSSIRRGSPAHGVSLQTITRSRTGRALHSHSVGPASTDSRSLPGEPPRGRDGPRTSKFFSISKIICVTSGEDLQARSGC